VSKAVLSIEAILSDYAAGKCHGIEAAHLIASKIDSDNVAEVMIGLSDDIRNGLIRLSRHSSPEGVLSQMDLPSGWPTRDGMSAIRAWFSAQPEEYQNRCEELPRLRLVETYIGASELTFRMRSTRSRGENATARLFRALGPEEIELLEAGKRLPHSSIPPLSKRVNLPCHEILRQIDRFLYWLKSWGHLKA
jgi:hypothetical protein